MIKGKLWRIPQQGKISGVCAGVAEYLGIPVRLLRVIAVLSLFFGLFVFTLVLYFALAFVLDEKPATVDEQAAPSNRERLAQLESVLNADEHRVREIERYVTSETFSVRSRFRQL